MRICLHKFVAVFLVFGLVTGTMSQASVFQMKNGSMPSADVSGSAEIATSLAEMKKYCKSAEDMANCAMKHPPRVSVGMGCCGCFLGASVNLRIDPLENRISGFGMSDVTGDSRNPTSLLKPPRA